MAGTEGEGEKKDPRAKDRTRKSPDKREKNREGKGEEETTAPVV